MLLKWDNTLFLFSSPRFRLFFFLLPIPDRNSSDRANHFISYSSLLLHERMKGKKNPFIKTPVMVFTFFPGTVVPILLDCSAEFTFAERNLRCPGKSATCVLRLLGLNAPMMSFNMNEWCREREILPKVIIIMCFQGFSCGFVAACYLNC